MPAGDDELGLGPGPSGCEAHVLALRMIAALPEGATVDDARVLAVRGLVRGWDDPEEG